MANLEILKSCKSILKRWTFCHNWLKISYLFCNVHALINSMWLLLKRMGQKKEYTNFIKVTLYFYLHIEYRIAILAKIPQVYMYIGSSTVAEYILKKNSLWGNYLTDYIQSPSEIWVNQNQWEREEMKLIYVASTDYFQDW